MRGIEQRELVPSELFATIRGERYITDATKVAHFSGRFWDLRKKGPAAEYTSFKGQLVDIWNQIPGIPSSAETPHITYQIEESKAEARSGLLELFIEAGDPEFRGIVQDFFQAEGPTQRAKLLLLENGGWQELADLAFADSPEQHRRFSTALAARPRENEYRRLRNLTIEAIIAEQFTRYQDSGTRDRNLDELTNFAKAALRLYNPGIDHGVDYLFALMDNPQTPRDFTPVVATKLYSDARGRDIALRLLRSVLCTNPQDYEAIFVRKDVVKILGLGWLQERHWSSGRVAMSSLSPEELTWLEQATQALSTYLTVNPSQRGYRNEPDIAAGLQGHIDIEKQYRLFERDPNAYCEWFIETLEPRIQHIQDNLGLLRYAGAPLVEPRRSLDVPPRFYLHTPDPIGIVQQAIALRGSENTEEKMRKVVSALAALAEIHYWALDSSSRSVTNRTDEQRWDTRRLAEQIEERILKPAKRFMPHSFDRLVEQERQERKASDRIQWYLT